MDHVAGPVANRAGEWCRRLDGGQILRVGSGSTPTFTRRVRTYFALLERELPPYVERQLLAIDALTEQILASAHSGHVDHPFRPKQISRSGHADHRSGATFGRPV